MKISTSYFFDRATQQLSTAQNRVATTQAQMATGKQLARPSDSPDQAIAIDRLRSALERQESIGQNLQTVQRRFQAEETALSSATDVFTRIKELSIQAANDTMGPDGRNVIAVELQTLRDQLVTVANSRDDQGQFLFSGARSDTAAYAATGSNAYAGDQTRTNMTSGEEDLQTFNRAGTDVFNRVVRETEDGPVGVGFFQAVDDLITAVKSGTQADMQRSIAEMDHMHQGMALATADVGARMNKVDTQMALIDETVLRLKTTLSDVEDLDYTEAVTRMNKQMLSLEAAMSSFSKVSQLNLFDYIR
ncbi:MAG: flagellar hook-associated protein FlgL [Hydrogenophaga sp.]|nr:flagellar hook-associated protein FlgL [Hydrogenophaga sp.]